MSLVRSDLVEISAKSIEATLLSDTVSSGRDRRLCLEVPVHAFVAAVLVWGCGLNEIGQNAELYPPDGEPGETAKGDGGEGSAVVGTDPIRETEFTEQACKNRPGARVRRACEPLTGKQISTEAILDGQGIAVESVQGLELVLEISGPDAVRRIEGSCGPAGMRSLPAFTSLLHETLALEILVQDLGGKDMPVRVQGEEPSPDLTRPPAHPSFAEYDSRFDHVGLGGMGAGMRCVGTVYETIRPLGQVSIKPFVTGLAADTIAMAEFGVREKATSRFEDELFAFFHGIGLHPGHGHLLAEGHITGRDCYPSALIEVLPISVECTQGAANKRMQLAAAARFGAPCSSTKCH